MAVLRFFALSPMLVLKPKKTLLFSDFKLAKEKLLNLGYQEDEKSNLLVWAPSKPP